LRRARPLLLGRREQTGSDAAAALVRRNRNRIEARTMAAAADEKNGIADRPAPTIGDQHASGRAF